MTVALSFVKPEAYGRRDEIVNHYHQNLRDLKLIGVCDVTLSTAEAEKFYEIHQSKPFYRELVEYISSGPIHVMVWQGEGDIISQIRLLVGDTDPKLARPGTIRAMFGTDKGKNAIHASDSAENAANEIRFFASIDRCASVFQQCIQS